jgi:L-malate glycosyltransferase
MKIYHAVESYYPSIGGMQEVVKQLSERMASMGHEVVVLTRVHSQRNFSQLNGVEIVEFKIEGNPFEANSLEEKRYVDFLLQLQGDVITFFAAQQWATNLALPVLKQINLKKVSVPTGYSGLFRAEFSEYFRQMKQWIHDYDMNVYLSNDYRDINFARENGVVNIELIPNGAALNEFDKDPGIDIRKHFGIPAHHKILLHVGSYTGRKGHKEAIQLFLNCGVKDCTLLMIGNDTSYFKRRTIFKYPQLLMQCFFSFFTSRKILMVEANRQTTVSAYFQSDLFFFPSQVECSPIVLFEAAAAGLPFLSTDVGNAVEIAEWTGGGEIMSTWKDENGFSYPRKKETITQLLSLLKDDNRLHQYATSGRKSWREKFTWEAITEQYLKLYQRLLQ